MTIIRKTKIVTRIGGQKVVSEVEYYEVGIHEVDAMLKKVAEGADENKLRKELIKTSSWGCGC